MPNTPVYRNRARWVLFTGLLTGIIDISIVFIVNHNIAPERICRYIASGAFGSEASTGPAAFAWLGLLFHFIIAMIWTTVFFLLFPALRRMLKSKLLQIIVTGVVIWAIMNLIVVPLTRIPSHHLKLWPSVREAVILIIAYGVPITLIAEKYYSRKPAAALE